MGKQRDPRHIRLAKGRRTVRQTRWGQKEGGRPRKQLRANGQVIKLQKDNKQRQRARGMQVEWGTGQAENGG